MDRYRIEEFAVSSLWGYRDIKISLRDDVNILIGPNASGKTTILNLLRYVFTGDVWSLADIKFDRIRIKLVGFNDRRTQTITVISTENKLEFRTPGQKFDIDLRLLPWQIRDRSVRAYLRRNDMAMFGTYEELREYLQGLVPAVWLPVSRRLPMPDDEGEREPDVPSRLESVDARLESLMRELALYRFELNKPLAESYKDFERRVLETILYSREYDSLEFFKPTALPGKLAKEQLLRAFEAVDLLDERIRTRIDEHFAAAQEVMDRIAKARREGRTPSVETTDVLIIPLIGRTELIVGYAREMEEYREQIFTPLHRYEKIVNTFLNGKKVRVEDNGELVIDVVSQEQRISSQQLSSGEKQLLILLTQALLSEDEPIVYVVDEPELSLHVKWQESLLESLLALAPKTQVIVATHSPDIVGSFLDKVIDLGAA